MATLLRPPGPHMFRLFNHQSLLELDRLQEERKRTTEAGGRLEEEPAAPNADLEAGKSLPLIYGDPPAELLNTPLEDLDSFYFHTHKVRLPLSHRQDFLSSSYISSVFSFQTFIVITKGKTIFRFNAEPACYTLSAFSRLRRAAIRILIHSYPSTHYLQSPQSETYSGCVSSLMLDQIIQHVHNGYDSVQLRIHDDEQPSGVEQNSRVGPCDLQHT